MGDQMSFKIKKIEILTNLIKEMDDESLNKVLDLAQSLDTEQAKRKIERSVDFNAKRNKYWEIKSEWNDHIMNGKEINDELFEKFQVARVLSREIGWGDPLKNSNSKFCNL